MLDTFFFDEGLMDRRNGLAIGAALVALANFMHPAFSADYPTRELFLEGAVFDDGGQATGTFWWNVSSRQMPLPQFYNIRVSTSAGSTLPGSYFSSAQVCYNDTKKFVCAPNDNFIISVEVGIPGEPGYDHFQFATYFAPQALGAGRIGVLDPAMSYETACVQKLCSTRYIVAGSIRP